MGSEIRGSHGGGAESARALHTPLWHTKYWSSELKFCTLVVHLCWKHTKKIQTSTMYHKKVIVVQKCSKISENIHFSPSLPSDSNNQ